MRITKQGEPIVLFTLVAILFFFLQGVPAISYLFLAIVIFNAFKMAKNIKADPCLKKSSAVIELIYILLVFLALNYLTPMLGKFMTGAIVIALMAIYIGFINPKWLGRTLV